MFSNPLEVGVGLVLIALDMDGSCVARRSDDARNCRRWMHTDSDVVSSCGRCCGVLTLVAGVVVP